MEIRFNTDDESPHYLAQFVLSRISDDEIQLEVTDQRNTQKCCTIIPLDKFIEAMAFLGALKVVGT